MGEAPARHEAALKLPLTPDKIESSVRELALAPVGQPLRRGSFYVLHAFDPYGIEMRVVADAELGDILSVTPVLMPYPDRALGSGARAHIIHVPQAGDDDDAVPPSQHKTPPRHAPPPAKPD